ncbi:MAG TPA: MraY family glycosyltransferase, partial [Rhodothermales bacterium]|nr:MraY family glycosyltransferase [Rhodothermales bacterium]
MEVLALLVGFLCSFVTAVGCTKMVRDLAIRHELLDHPDLYRKVHEVSTPRFGGIAMVLSTLVGLGIYLLLALILDFSPNLPDGYILAGAFVMVLTGVLDDFLHLSVRHKLIGQIVATLIFVMSDVTHRIYLPEFKIMGIDHHTVAILVTVLWLLGIVNAMNLIDGLDGLAAGISVIAIVWFTAIYASQQVIPNTVAGIVLLGALLGFLVYNFRPASIFMGDTGSLTIGFFLAVYAIPSFNAPFYFSGTALADAWVPAILILGLPILDTLSSVFRRTLSRRSIFAPDQDHIHHKVVKVWGLSHLSAVLLLYGVGFFLGFAAWLYANSGGGGKVITLLIVAGGLVVFFI